MALLVVLRHINLSGCQLSYRQAKELSPEWSVGALTAALDLSAVTVVNIWQCVTHP